MKLIAACENKFMAEIISNCYTDHSNPILIFIVIIPSVNYISAEILNGTTGNVRLVPF